VITGKDTELIQVRFATLGTRVNLHLEEFLSTKMSPSQSPRLHDLSIRYGTP
jgi:hypothetical protein